MPSGNPAIISTALHINTDSQLVSLTSIYLLGYIFGPLGFGPLSEIYGRRAILIPTFFSFCIFTLASALSPIYSALIIFRFLTGLAASAPITIVGGVYADIYDDPISRGRTMAAFLAVCDVSSDIGSLNIDLNLGQHIWAYIRASDIWLFFRAWLAMAVLDRLDIWRILVDTALASS
jgi:MFS family permease